MQVPGVMRESRAFAVIEHCPATTPTANTFLTAKWLTHTDFTLMYLDVLNSAL